MFTQYAGAIVVASGNEQTNATPFPAWMVGAVVLAVLLVLLTITVSFSHTGNRVTAARAREEDLEQHSRGPFSSASDR